MRWIWIDKFIAFESGKRAVALKNVTMAEEHLHDHFPGFPVMPEALMIEGMAQTAGILVGEAGSAGLGGGLRLANDLYFAVDNEDQRQFDLVPLYLYNGRFVFFRGTAGGVHVIHNDNFELNLLGRDLADDVWLVAHDHDAVIDVRERDERGPDRDAAHEAGRAVTLCGWVDARRDLGGLIFLGLRDHSGIVQIVIEPDSPTVREV